MNEKKLRIAIHKSLGWVARPSHNPDFKRVWIRGADYCFALPDYTGSRDAAVEAVIELCDTELKRNNYGHQIKDLTDIYGYDISVATPLQICTALAKALNLPINQEDEE